MNGYWHWALCCKGRKVFRDYHLSSNPTHLPLLLTPFYSRSYLAFAGDVPGAFDGGGCGVGGDDFHPHLHLLHVFGFPVPPCPPHPQDTGDLLTVTVLESCW